MAAPRRILPTPDQFLSKNRKQIDISRIERHRDEERFDYIAAAFTYLLNRSDGNISGIKAYSLTYDWGSLINVLNIQRGSLIWLRDAVHLLLNLFRAGYTLRMPDPQYIPTGARPEDQHARIKSVVEMGCNLHIEWVEHFKEFLAFLHDTPGGERTSSHNIVQALRQGQTLSSCYRERINKNLSLFERLQELREEYNRLHLFFFPVFMAPHPRDLVDLRGIFYHPYTGEQVVVCRHPGMKPGQWHTFNFLLDREFDLAEDLINLGGSYGSYHICYRA